MSIEFNTSFLDSGLVAQDKQGNLFERAENGKHGAPLRCTFCFEDLKASSVTGHFKDAGTEHWIHAFHPSCLDQWITRSTSCPCCQKTIQLPARARIVVLARRALLGIATLTSSIAVPVIVDETIGLCLLVLVQNLFSSE